VQPFFGMISSMLRHPALVLFALVALGCSAGSAVGGSESATGSKPSLELVSSAPLTVRGRGFRAGERVRVFAGGASRQVRASSRGSFVLTLGSGDRCNVVRVRAVSASGAVAVLKVLASPQCPPPA
jgi:hypothetical protein